jgi:hypothetical protein
MNARTLALIVTLLPMCGAYAQQALAPLPELNNYAWGFPIETTEPASFYRVELPGIVNESAADPDLRDTGVYNAAGQAVPRLLEAGRDEVEQRESLHALPFAALYRDLEPDPERIRLMFEQMGGQLRIDVRSDGAEASKIRPPLSGYIVDARGVEGRLDALEFSWPEHLRGFVGRVNVEAGNDLENWAAVGGGALADLNEDAVAIEQHRIGIAATDRDFLRLTWSGMPPGWGLDGVTGVQFTATPQRNRKTLRLEASGRDEDDGGLLFDAGGRIRVDRVGLHFPQINTVVTTDIYYWNGAVERWIPVHRGSFHHIRRSDTIVTSSAATIGSQRAARWKVLVASGHPETPMQLELGWRPDTLLFVAQGNGPYTLGTGRASAAAEQYPQERIFGGTELRELADDNGPVAEATLGPRFPLGGIARELPKEPLDWRTILLWSGLVLAVLFVAWMATHLLRESR